MSRRPRRRTAVALLAGCLLLIAGCGEDGSSEGAGAAVADIAATTAEGGDGAVATAAGEVRLGPAGEPWEFVERTELPSCGTLDHRLRRGMPTEVSAEAECLLDAVGSAEGAELVREFTTLEGDLITEYIRALPNSPVVETFTDTTADKFGPRLWSRGECTGLTLSPMLFEYEDCSAWEEYLARQITGRWVDAGTIDFRADGTWSASDDCVSGSGTFTVDEVGTFSAEVLEQEATGSAECDSGDSDRSVKSAASGESKASARSILKLLVSTAQVVVTVDRLSLHRGTGDHYLATYMAAEQ